MAGKGESMVRKGVSDRIFLSFNIEHTQVNVGMNMNFDSGEDDWVIEGESTERIKDSKRC